MWQAGKAADSVCEVNGCRMQVLRNAAALLSHPLCEVNRVVSSCIPLTAAAGGNMLTQVVCLAQAKPGVCMLRCMVAAGAACRDQVTKWWAPLLPAVRHMCVR